MSRVAGELRFLGHAAFDLRAGGVRLVLDPHRPGAVGGRVRLPAIVGPFDAIVCSHAHDDHAGWTPALGTSRWIERDCELGPLQLRFLSAPHDAEGGTRMGMTRLVRIAADGWTLVHSGDLGAVDDRVRTFAAGADVLLLACGGTFTLDPEAAAAFAHDVAPRVVVPMHCADPAVDLPLAAADAFVAAHGAAAQTLDVLPLPVDAGLRGVVRLRRPEEST